MHLLLLAGFAAGCLALIWLAQTAALLAIGHRNIWVLPYRHGVKSQVVRWAMKIAMHFGLVSTLFVYPWMIGADPWQYHWQRLIPFHWQTLVYGVGMAIGLMSIQFFIGLAIGWIHLGTQYSPSTLAFKLFKSIAIPIPLTFVEEPFFRGIVQEQLLDALPSQPIGQCWAVIIGAALFAAVHFIRPHKIKMLPALGLFGLGIVLSLAYIRTGHHYLLPMAIHAGGVWFIQTTRHIAQYEGPAWLIGYPAYPICGGMGLALMAIMGVIIMH